MGKQKKPTQPVVYNLTCGFNLNVPVEIIPLDIAKLIQNQHLNTSFRPGEKVLGLGVSVFCEYRKGSTGKWYLTVNVSDGMDVISDNDKINSRHFESGYLLYHYLKIPGETKNRLNRFMSTYCVQIVKKMKLNIGRPELKIIPYFELN